MPGRRAARAAPGHRRAALARRRHRPARPRARALRRSGAPGALLRHRRRRRGAAAPARASSPTTPPRAAARRWRPRWSRRRCWWPTAAGYRDARRGRAPGAGGIAAAGTRGSPATGSRSAEAVAARAAAGGRRRSDGDRSSLAARARRRRRAARVVVAGEPDAPGVPLLADRPLRRRGRGGVRVPRLRLRPPGVTQLTARAPDDASVRRRLRRVRLAANTPPSTSAAV